MQRPVVATTVGGTATAAAPSLLPLARSSVPELRGLQRERLLELLRRLWEQHLGLVVAPAGSGKTTLITQFAASAGVPVAYYLADRSDESSQVFLAHLSASCARALPSLPPAPRTADELVVALEQGVDGPTLLVIDDFQELAGTSAEQTLERLLFYRPPDLAVLIASRLRPRLNWSRLLVSGGLLEVGTDDLRFRFWEVERLFSDFYEEPLPPGDLAELARRTEGWAAGLKLFQLATSGRPTAERHRMLASLNARWRVAHDYLARNVLEGLEPELRDFLIDTCVVTSLSGRVCDLLLARGGSERILRELSTRQIFTFELDDGSFRYHEALRAQLELMLVERLGERDRLTRFLQAGELLEAEGELSDALRAYCRAEAWEDVQRLLGRDGHRIVHGRPLWLDEFPPSVLDNDPWLLLALARQQRGIGRFGAAAETYRRAELLAGGSGSAGVFRRERVALAQWVEPNAPRSVDATGLLRAAIDCNPRLAGQAAEKLRTAEGLVTSGLSLLLAGDCRRATSILERAIDEVEPASTTAAGAQLGLAIAHLLSGLSVGAGEAALAAEWADAAGALWLARLSRAALALTYTPEGAAAAAEARIMSQHEQHDWGMFAGALLEGLGALGQGESPVKLLEQAADGFHTLCAEVLEAWARGGLALAYARDGDPGARDSALGAERLGHRNGVAPARLLAYLALATLDPTDDAGYSALAEALRTEHGLDGLPTLEEAVHFGTDRSAPSLDLRCLGGLQMRVRGRIVNLAQMKPRARSLLRLLAMHEGRPVHREVLMDALWPECDLISGARNLQVLVSSLRQALEPGRTRGDETFVRREGDAYRLALDGAKLDLTAFHEALARGRASADLRVAADAYGEALDLYTGELYPEEGPADWVLERREQLVDEATEAARGLAGVLLALGDPAGAVQACTRGLGLDRKDGSLLRLRADALEAARATA